MLFDKLPKTVALAILLIKALDLPKTIELTQQILYLWREFSVKIDIKPIIDSFKISFYYKDKFIQKLYIKELDEILPVIYNIEKVQSEKNDKKE